MVGIKLQFSRGELIIMLVTSLGVAMLSKSFQQIDKEKVRKSWSIAKERGLAARKRHSGFGRGPIKMNFFC